jgi:hypothetical protein
MAAPVRIQRKRTNGWRMPPNTVSVTRPGKWGNPFGDLALFVEVGNGYIAKLRGKSLFAADAFRMWLKGDLILSPEVDRLRPKRQWILEHVHELTGRDLACWCKEGMPCHADVLLELANAEPRA